MPDSLELKFRNATRTDIPAIVRVLSEDELGAQRERYETPLPQAYYIAFEAIVADPNQELIATEWKGEVVGTLRLAYLTSLSYQGGTRAQVKFVRVMERLHGQGIGVGMMEWAIKRARQ